MTAKEQTQRGLLATIAAVVAVVFIMPVAMHHAPQHREYVIRIALIPAAAAWLTLWKMPGSYGLASFRTVMLTIALVGAGGLGLLAVSELTSPWIKETMGSARFVPQAIIYVGIGLFGLLGSLLVRGDERAESD